MIATSFDDAFYKGKVVKINTTLPPMAKVRYMERFETPAEHTKDQYWVWPSDNYSYYIAKAAVLSINVRIVIDTKWKHLNKKTIYLLKEYKAWSNLAKESRNAT